ncbi:MAG: amidase [Actinomycetota bacterium]
MTDLAFTPAVEQAELVRTREVSPVELVTLYLERIEKLDGQLNSYVTVTADEAMAAARAAEEAVTSGADLPPFHGVPISIKDLFETKGVRSTFSCRALAEYVPDQDDNAVRRIKEAGFIMLGKTNTSEFGTVPVTESLLNGIARNPWNTDHTPGGSSGGAAAGVAAGLAPVAHGSDGGGSVRIPSSCCGLFGIKPSRGRISAGPRLGEYWHGFSTQGSIGRTVRDAAALLDVMQGYEVGDPYSAPVPERPFSDEVGLDPGKLRVGYTLTNPNEVEVDPVVKEAVAAAAKLLESLGHSVEEVDPGWVDPALAPQFIQLIQTGTAVVDFLPKDQIEPLNRFLIENAHQISSVQHIQALAAVQSFARRVMAFWNTYDILLTPTLALPPLPVGFIFSDDDPMMQLVRSGMFIPFTPTANVTGQPAVSVPLYRSDAGLPIGVQLMGRAFDEATLIRLSAQLEEAEPWAGERPPLG